jgi:hypothetical protein
MKKDKLKKDKLKKYEDIWLDDPEEHDYPNAFDYLSLVMDEITAEQKVDDLEKAMTIFKKAKDILRASGLPLLPKNNIHVKANLNKVKSGKKLSPILLVVGWSNNLIIADGYHRVCCIYYLSEDLIVPCRLV